MRRTTTLSVEIIDRMAYVSKHPEIYDYDATIDVMLNELKMKPRQVAEYAAYKTHTPNKIRKSVSKEQREAIRSNRAVLYAKKIHDHNLMLSGIDNELDRENTRLLMSFADNFMVGTIPLSNATLLQIDRHIVSLSESIKSNSNDLEILKLAREFIADHGSLTPKDMIAILELGHKLETNR